MINLGKVKTLQLLKVLTHDTHATHVLRRIVNEEQPDPSELSGHVSYPVDFNQNQAIIVCQVNRVPGAQPGHGICNRLDDDISIQLFVIPDVWADGKLSNVSTAMPILLMSEFRTFFVTVPSPKTGLSTCSHNCSMPLPSVFRMQLTGVKRLTYRLRCRLAPEFAFSQI